MFFVESYWTFKLLNNFKATIMLCFEIWISLFVLKLFNILHSFLVTVVYRLQVRGKTLGLCSVQAIEVFKHQLVLVDSGISDTLEMFLPLQTSSGLVQLPKPYFLNNSSILDLSIPPSFCRAVTSSAEDDRPFCICCFFTFCLFLLLWAGSLLSQNPFSSSWQIFCKYLSSIFSFCEPAPPWVKIRSSSPCKYLSPKGVTLKLILKP